MKHTSATRPPLYRDQPLNLPIVYTTHEEPLYRDQSLNLPIVYSTTHEAHLCYKTTSLQRPVPQSPHSVLYHT